MKKSLKKQAVFPVLMLLVVTALALIGSSFAWFAMTNVAAVSSFEANIEQGSTGLMISANGVDYVGNVTLASANDQSDKTIQKSTSYIFPGALHQVSTKDAVKFFEAEIKSKAQDGTVATITSKADLSHPEANMKAPVATVGQNAQSQDLTAHIIVFDLYFQVDVDSNLYLNAGSEVITTSNTANVTEAHKAMRVAFLSCGNNADSATAVAQGYTPSANSLVIWKPYAAETGEPAATYGLVAANSTAFNAYSLVSGTAEATTEYTGTAIVPESNLAESSNAPAQQAIASLTAGYNKVRVVIWLEGQDPDCVVKIAKGKIQVTLNFFAYAATNNNSGN